MTKASKVLGQLLGLRLKEIAGWLGLYVLLILGLSAAYALGWVDEGNYFGLPLSAMVFGLFAGFVRLAMLQEQLWTSNWWRLLPLPSWQLMVIGTLATWLTQLMLWLGAGLITAAWLTVVPGGPDLGAANIQGGLVLVALALVVELWFGAMISTVHLLTEMISDYLPDLRQKVVKVVLYAGLFVGLEWLLSGLFDLMWRLAAHGRHPEFSFSFGTSTADWGTSVQIPAGIGQAFLPIFVLLGLGTVALVCLNAYLLNHVETKQPQQVG